MAVIINQAEMQYLYTLPKEFLCYITYPYLPYNLMGKVVTKMLLDEG